MLTLGASHGSFDEQARMERSAIRVSRTQHDSPGLRFAPPGLRVGNYDESDTLMKKAKTALINP